MKKLKRTISLLLAISVLALANFQAVAAVISFKDVKKTDWHYDYVNKLIELKITSGYTDGTFRPNSAVTRAEFVTFLCKVLGHEQAQGDPFNDTQKHWSSGYVTIALANGIIDLPVDKKFRPDVPITRLEAAEMICRAFNLPKDLKSTAFTDVANTDKGYTNTVYNEYLMAGSVKNGKRYFYPKTSLIRGEVAAVVVNMADYKADPMSYKNKKIDELKEKAAQENAEQAKYQAWKDSVKTIPVELLGNTQGLKGGTVYLSYKYLRNEEAHYLKNWGAKYNMTPDAFEKEMVRVGTKFMETWYNADYRKLDTLETNLKSILETNVINNYLQRNLDYVKNNKFVSEGTFNTSTGMLVFADWGNPVLRGTIKYRYLSPTSSDVLNSEIIGSTGKPIQLSVWYEQDFEIRFYAEKDGFKCTDMQAISDIRIAK